MANMSYCRFENTYRDLADCVGALEDGEKLSASEKRFAKYMRDLCEEYIELFDELEELTEEKQEL